MNFNYFMNYLQTFLQLSPDLQAELKIRVKEINVEKGSILLYPNSICKHVYFICSGFFRIFTTENEIEETIDFASTDQFITSLKSFFTQKNGKEGIISETDGVLLKINYHDLLALYELEPDFLRLSSLVMQQYFLLLNDEKNVFRTANATEKYLYLNQQYPGIVNMVSHKHIASYLGVTAPTFSNLLKDLLNKPN